jgi:hypothetical protein
MAADGTQGTKATQDTQASVDDVITRITEADTDAEAMAVLESIPRRVLAEVADQLYVDTFGRSLETVRKECLREARA